MSVPIPPTCFNPQAWSLGHFADGAFDDGLIKLGNALQITSILGTAQAGNWGSQAASDAYMERYDLLFFRARLGREIPPVAKPFRQELDAPLFGYRVSGKAVGWDLSSDDPADWPLDDGTPGNLLLAGKPITLPWGAYWIILTTLAVETPPVCASRSNSDLWYYVRAEPNIIDGEPYRFTLAPGGLNGLTEDGHVVLRIDGDQVVQLRVNRRDFLPE